MAASLAQFVIFSSFALLFFGEAEFRSVEMAESNSLHRRRFIQLSGYALGTSLGQSFPMTSVLAQTTGTTGDPLEAWRELGELTLRAVDLGLSVPRMGAHIDTSQGQDYMQIMPATVDLIASLEKPQPTRDVPPSEIEILLKRADDLLRRIHQEERNLPDERPDGISLTTSSLRPPFDSIKDDYRRLFEACSVRDQYASTANWYITKLMNADYQKQWFRVAQEVCCPWYFIAIIHAMEGSFNFRSHLHNGDSLNRRTVNIPRGRPKNWNPPSDWISSAADAVRFDGFAGISEWSLERTLYRWESYNGWRSRRNGINTPYLWSFSNHYSKGKFVADNVWDANSVSKQCGAAVMLKLLVEREAVTLPD